MVSMEYLEGMQLPEAAHWNWVPAVHVVLHI